MGGFGSGRRKGRPTSQVFTRVAMHQILSREVRRQLAISVAAHQWLLLNPILGTAFHETHSVKVSLHFAASGERWLIFDYGEGHQSKIFLEAIPGQFGGHRWFMRCPRIDDVLCTVLYRPRGQQHAAFASRKAWRMHYQSQRQDTLANAQAALDRAKKKLGHRAYPRPKGRHWRTHIKLVHRHTQQQERYVRALKKLAGDLRAAVTKTAAA